MAKIKVSDERKAFIKSNAGRLDKSTLPPAERHYLTLVENGRRAAAERVRFEGRYTSAQMSEYIKGAAAGNKTTVTDYIEKHKEAIGELMASGYTQVESRPDNIIDMIAGSGKRYIYFDTGDGIVRLSRNDAIKEIAQLQNRVASSTAIVDFRPKVLVFENGKIQVKMPLGLDARKRTDGQTSTEYYEEELSVSDIFLIISADDE